MAAKPKTAKKPKKAKLDITSHILVPKHTKLSENEKKALFEKYKISLKDLPRISKKDPAIQHLDVEYGDIIKIERQSPTSGKVVYYRGVLNE